VSEQEQLSAKEPLSQASFEGTPYEDAQWEVVGSVPDSENFEPLEVPVLASNACRTDPMFADYSEDTPISSGVARWHLPEHLAHVSPRERALQEQQAVDDRIHLAPSEFERLKNEAYESGKAEVVESAVAANLERMTTMESSVQAIIQDLAKQMNERVTLIEKQAVDLALAIAHKLVGEAVEINPEYVVAMVKQAISLSGAATIKRIRVSVQDHEFVEVLGVKRLFPQCEESWKFEGDASVRAGCIVETSAGEIDMRIEESWERVRAGIMKAIR